MPRASITVSVVLLMCGIAGTPLHAQQYRGEGGTLLDKNLQIGSNGKNPRGRDIRDQIWFNNQIITGNAPAGKSFRGSVGYTAVNQFRGAAGSDSLYSFQRDSTSAAQVATGVRASDALRYQMSLTTGQSAPAYLANSYIVRRDSDAATANTSTTTSSALRSTADYLSSRSLRPTLVRSGTDPDGREWSLTASPLVGFSKVYINPPVTQQPKDVLAPAPTVTPGAPPMPANLTEPAPSITPGAPSTPVPEGGWPSNKPTGIESRGVNFRSEWERAGADDMRRASNALARGTDTKVETTAVDSRSATHVRMLDTLRTTYGEQGKPVGPGEAAAKGDQEPKDYADRELERIRRVLRGLSPTAPEPSTTPASTPDPSDATPTDAATDPAKLINDAASRDPLKPDPPKDKDDKTKPISPEIMRALRSLGEKSLDAITPSISAQNEPEVYRVHMTEAERALRDGRYFDAEDRFTRAIAAMPADALAKVGRVHAQLAAGLYLSASTNLRQLLSANPEIVGVRFDPKFAPSPDRIKHIATQLRAEVDQGSTGMGLEASLLLTYLGRMSGDQAMIDEGLNAMESRLPADDSRQARLHELLKGVWGSPK